MLLIYLKFLLLYRPPSRVTGSLLSSTFEEICMPQPYYEVKIQCKDLLVKFLIDIFYLNLPMFDKISDLSYHVENVHKI